MQIAGEVGAVDDTELRQVRLEVGATTLNLVPAQLDRRAVVVGLGEPAVGVRDALVGEALEERVEEFVVPTDAPPP